MTCLLAIVPGRKTYQMTYDRPALALPNTSEESDWLEEKITMLGKSTHREYEVSLDAGPR